VTRNDLDFNDAILRGEIRKVSEKNEIQEEKRGCSSVHIKLFIPRRVGGWIHGRAFIIFTHFPLVT
jgi:hypothetical protein